MSKQSIRDALDWGWQALHLGPVSKKYRQDLCECDPDVGAVPCEYCALHEALQVAEEMYKERLKNA